MTAGYRRTGSQSAFLLVVALAGSAPALAQDSAIDSLEFADPVIPTATVEKVFPERLTSLWLQALARPEAEYKCQAATAIALAHRRGMPGLESTVGPLLQVLDQPGQHASVRLAVAQTLIALEARQAAASFFDHDKEDDVDFRNLVEPALADWKYAPASTTWLERLERPGQAELATILAIRGLSNVHELKAVGKLRELILESGTDPTVRLEAARALGNLQSEGLEKEAEQLAAQKLAPPEGVAHLAAVALLRKHRSESATKILQRLAVDAEPVTATSALERLLELDPQFVVSLLPRVLASPAATVRQCGVEAFRRRPQKDHLGSMAELMDDPHPRVRAGARQALVEMAPRAEFGEAIRSLATRLLASERWRGLEQATILLAILDHKPAAPRMVQLLRFQRPEVFVAAAWGLRKLGDPATWRAQLDEVERRWQSPAATDTKTRDAIDRELSQLCQSLGQARYTAAVPTLARFIPKQVLITFGPHSRVGAIWALGLICEKDPAEALVRGLIGRLSDESMSMPEHLRIRRICAISLGRMKASESVDALGKYYPGLLSPEPFPNACGWALEQITGEKLPRTGIAKAMQTGWFLESVD